MADDRALAEEIEIESPELWTETVLRSYLSDRERKDCDLPELRQRMLDASGRTGEGVRCLLNAMGDRGEKFDDAASAVLKELGRRAGLASNFGIGPDLEPIYVAISHWAPCSHNDVKTIVDDEFNGVTPISIEGIIQYGIWMGALFRDQELKIDVNPLLKSRFGQRSP
jgi:hypothetical protein